MYSQYRAIIDTFIRLYNRLYKSYYLILYNYLFNKVRLDKTLYEFDTFVYRFVSSLQYLLEKLHKYPIYKTRGMLELELLISYKVVTFDKLFKFTCDNIDTLGMETLWMKDPSFRSIQTISALCQSKQDHKKFVSSFRELSYKYRYFKSRCMSDEYKLYTVERVLNKFINKTINAVQNSYLKFMNVQVSIGGGNLDFSQLVRAGNESLAKLIEHCKLLYTVSNLYKESVLTIKEELSKGVL